LASQKKEKKPLRRRVYLDKNFSYSANGKGEAKMAEIEGTIEGQFQSSAWF
jgi:hypothetical protein